MRSRATIATLLRAALVRVPAVIAVVLTTTLLASAFVLLCRYEQTRRGMGGVEPVGRPRLAYASPQGTSERIETEVALTFFETGGREITVPITWDDAWFAEDLREYNHELACTCAVLSSLAYAESAHYQSGTSGPAYMEQALESLGFDEVRTGSYRYRSEVVDQVLNVFTSKEDTVEAMCRQLYNTNIEALTQTLNLLDEKTLCRAVDIFVKAGRVMCFGYGGSMPVAQKAWTRFLTVSPKFFTIQDTHMQIMASSLLDKDDALLMVSYSGSPEETESVLQPARQRGAKVVLITHDPHSPAARLSDAVLLCGGNEKPLRAGSIAAHMAMLFVVDMLVNEFCRRDMETTMQNKDRVTQALSSRHQ